MEIDCDRNLIMALLVDDPSNVQQVTKTRWKLAIDQNYISQYSIYDITIAKKCSCPCKILRCI